MGTSNLLNTPAGTIALKEATADIIRMRIRRWFERNTVIGFGNWVLAGKPAFTAADALGILDSLNEDHDIEILNLIDCLRQIDQTFSDLGLTWYVDTVNGNDTTGDGSQSAPFATISKVQGFYGQNAYINGKVNIMLTAPTTNKLRAITDWKILFGPSGQLTIQGMDAAKVLTGGPYTINAGGWADLGVATVMGHQITLNGAVLVPHAHKGHFMRVLTGAANRVGNYYCILDNTDTILYIARTSAPLAAGNTFEIVMPGTVIQPLPSMLDFDIEGLQAYEFLYGDRLIFTNIHLLGDLQIHSLYCGITFGFCYLEGTSKWLNCSSMFFNLCNPIDALQIVNAKQILGDCPLVWCKTLWVEVFTWVNARRITTGALTHAGGVLTMAWSAMFQVSNFDGNLIFNDSLLGETGGDHFAYISHLNALGLYTLGCDDFINQVLDNGYIELSNIEGVAPTGYTIRAGAFSRTKVTVANVVHGAVNDVYWSFALAAAAFPIAGASITDGDGAFLIGV